MEELNSRLLQPNTAMGREKRVNLNPGLSHYKSIAFYIMFSKRRLGRGQGNLIMLFDLKTAAPGDKY